MTQPATTTYNKATSVHPDLKRMRQRAHIVQCIRQFFWAQGFCEVDTPVALSTVAAEAHIDAPAVYLNTGHTTERRFLQTSPELPMKRLLAAGLSPIFQIAPCFREGDFGPLHRPEFRLLEWYRAPGSWTQLMEDCESLLRFVLQQILPRDRFTFQGKPMDVEAPFRRISMEEAFQEHAGFSVLSCLDTERLREQLRRLDIPHQADEPWDDLFFRVFLNRVEPALCRNPNPFFLTDYPRPLAALARLSPSDARVAERFELYVGGLELANGYGELTNPEEQRQRFDTENARRKALKLPEYPQDENFFAALAALPEACGIALGLERLLMVLLDAEDIDTVAFVPWRLT